MNKLFALFVGSISLLTAGAAVFFLVPEQPKKVVSNIANTITNSPSPTPTVALNQPQTTKILPQHTFVSQSFNNCGPATLTMLMNWFGNPITQDVLGNKLRPYQIPGGDNDDKSVTFEELAKEAGNYGFVAYHRPNGDMEKMKLFIANDIPVAVRTWLHPNEDIGHYRVVRGYNDQNQTLLQDDSYEGPNLTYSYETFNQMWQAFNYEYLIVVPNEKKAIVEAILKDETDSKVSFQKALVRAEQEEKINSSNPYPVFNQLTSHYHLGNFQKTVELYERIENQLPPRMLWYQIEPIEAYAQLGNAEKVYSHTDFILNNQNRAFSELYILRGDIQIKLGNHEQARQEYEAALRYNQNMEEAKQKLSGLPSV